MRTEAEINAQLSRLKLSIKEERKALSKSNDYNDFHKKLFVWGMTQSEIDTLTWVLSGNKSKANGRKERRKKV